MRFKFLLIIILLSSCYNQRKATQQFSRAAIAYPLIPANYCAITYPVKDSTIRDTLLTTDTTFIEGQDLVDTVRSLDTTRITTIHYLPGKIITNTFHVIDTIYQENTAKLQVCQLERSTALNLLQESEKRLSIAQSKATKRGWIMWGLLLLILLIVGWKVYNSFKPKIKTI
jgi:hypothetical protein